MDFLGDVNVFQARLEHGKAVVPGLEVAYPDYPHSEGRDATLYVRPHEFLVERSATGAGSIEAKVLHITVTGSRVKVELRAVGSDQLINAELTTERFADLNLKSGDVVYIVPRRVHVFVP